MLLTGDFTFLLQLLSDISLSALRIMQGRTELLDLLGEALFFIISIR